MRRGGAALGEVMVAGVQWLGENGIRHEMRRSVGEGKGVRVWEGRAGNGLSFSAAGRIAAATRAARRA